MSDTGTTRKPRFKGEISLDNVQPSAPVERAGVDLARFVELVNKSWEAKQAGSATPAFTVVIPAGAATIVENRFRQAAKQVGCGISWQTFQADTRKAQDAGVQPGQILAVVEARPRKAAPGTTAKNAAPAAAKPSNIPGKGGKK